MIGSKIYYLLEEHDGPSSESYILKSASFDISTWQFDAPSQLPHPSILASKWCTLVFPQEFLEKCQVLSSSSSSYLDKKSSSTSGTDEIYHNGSHFDLRKSNSNNSISNRQNHRKGDATVHRNHLNSLRNKMESSCELSPSQKTSASHHFHMTLSSDLAAANVFNCKNRTVKLKHFDISKILNSNSEINWKLSSINEEKSSSQSNKVSPLLEQSNSVLKSTLDSNEKKSNNSNNYLQINSQIVFSSDDESNEKNSFENLTNSNNDSDIESCK